jgi:cytochrome P450
MLAGHDTVASALSWMLLDLARHPEDQRRVREEAASFRAKTSATGGLTATDLDAMTFTTAAIKVHNTLPCSSGLADVPQRSHYV